MQLLTLVYDNRVADIKKTFAEHPSIDINTVVVPKTKGTLLMVAVSCIHLETVDVLLRHMANVYLVDTNGNNVLHKIANKLCAIKNAQEKEKLYQITLMLLQTEHSKNYYPKQYASVLLENTKNNAGFLPKDFFIGNKTAQQEFEKFVSESVSSLVNETRNRSQSATEENKKEEKLSTGILSTSLPTSLAISSSSSSSSLTTDSSLSNLRSRAGNNEEKRRLLSEEEPDAEVDTPDEASDNSAAYKIKIS